MGLPHGPTEEEFTSAIRGNARIIDFAAPRPSTCTRRSGAAFWQLRACDRRTTSNPFQVYESYLSNVVSIYGGVFKDWSSSVVNVLAKRFANYADSYRAQAERAQSGSTVGAEEVQRIAGRPPGSRREVPATEAVCQLSGTNFGRCRLTREEPLSAPARCRHFCRGGIFLGRARNDKRLQDAIRKRGESTHWEHPIRENCVSGPNSLESARKNNAAVICAREKAPQEILREIAQDLWKIRCCSKFRAIPVSGPPSRIG